MRLERINYNKIKIFLTTDDLTDRGLTKEDIWKDSLKWHQLFHEMLDEATEEFGVDFQGSVEVEIFSMHAQGMIMIVSMEEQGEESLNDEFLEMQVTTKGNDEILLFEFQDIEEVIRLSKRLACIQFFGGSLYILNDLYYFCVNKNEGQNSAQLVANIAEFGDVSLESIYRLNEYGNCIIEDKAVKTLVHYFQ